MEIFIFKPVPEGRGPHGEPMRRGSAGFSRFPGNMHKKASFFANRC